MSESMLAVVEHAQKRAKEECEKLKGIMESHPHHVEKAMEFLYREAYLDGMEGLHKRLFGRSSKDSADKGGK